METGYEETLVFPSSYATLDEEEMMYVEGGYAIGVSKSMLDKSYCLSLGAALEKGVGMTQLRIAKEVYAHAKMYYASTAQITAYMAILGGGIAMSTVTYIREHSNPINLGGDNAVRVALYTAAWNNL